MTKLPEVTFHIYPTDCDMLGHLNHATMLNFLERARWALLEPQIAALVGYAREGKLTPRVDRAFPLAEAAAAHRYIHERRNVGKVVLTFD